MKDEDPIPFGKYKGAPIGEVPADYLLWFLAQDWSKKWPQVEAYCIEKEQQLQSEVDSGANIN